MAIQKNHSQETVLEAVKSLIFFCDEHFESEDLVITYAHFILFLCDSVVVVLLLLFCNVKAINTCRHINR